MKKCFFLAAAAAIVISAPWAFAQDKQFFNHAAIGVSVGMDGIGADLAMPIGPKFQFRAGYNTLNPLLSLVKIENIPLTDFSTSFPVNYHQNGMNIDNVDLSASLNYAHAELLFDFFPTSSSFHLTAGAMFAFNPLIHANGFAKNASGTNGIPQSDWANTTVFGVSTDTSGQIQADAKFGLNTVKPYVGLGFGRPVSLKNRVGFNFDLGVLVVGGLHIYSYDYSQDGNSPAAVEINSEWINKYEDIRSNVGEYTDYLDFANSLLVWPVMRFSLFVRLF